MKKRRYKLERSIVIRFKPKRKAVVIIERRFIPGRGKYVFDIPEVIHASGDDAINNPSSKPVTDYPNAKEAHNAQEQSTKNPKTTETKKPKAVTRTNNPEPVATVPSTPMKNQIAWGPSQQNPTLYGITTYWLSMSGNFRIEMYTPEGEQTPIHEAQARNGADTWVQIGARFGSWREAADACEVVLQSKGKGIKCST